MSQSYNKTYIGGKAPSFKATALLANGEIGAVNFPHDYAGKYVVLFFYPLDFTFVCPTEIIAFSDAAKQYRDAGCELVAVSIDSAYTHLAWTELPRNKGGLGKLNIPIVSDLTHQISRDYGVLLENEGHSIRGTFVVDGKGTVRAAHLHDPPVGRSVEETLRIVKAYQYTDIHGEVCPAGWNGQDKKSTIKPDPKNKIEYFSQQNGDMQQ